MQDFKEFKTYQLIKNNYFKDTLDWDIFLEQVVFEYSESIYSNESTFEDRFVTNYKGYDIYEYQSTGRLRYTFWLSPIDSDYYSSIENIADCEFLIDRILEEKWKFMLLLVLN